MQNIRLSIAFLLLLGLISSCHKDNSNGPQADPAYKNYYIKSFALSTLDSTAYSYDDHMRLVKKVIYSPNVNASNGKDSTIYLFSYNITGQLNIITTEVSNGLTTFTSSYEAFEYYPDGRLLNTYGLTQYFQILNSQVYSYNSKNQVDSINIYITDMYNNTILLNTMFYKYDTAGNCSECTTTYKGTVVSDTKFTEYDNYKSMFTGLPYTNYAQSDGNIVPKHNIISFSSVYPPDSASETFSYKYNSAGYPISETYSNNGNPITHRITYYGK